MQRVFSLVHITIAYLYFETGILLGFVAATQSLSFRIELSSIGSLFFAGDGSFYNVSITAHGLIIVFGFIMPVTMGGFANFLIPMLLLTPDMIFPRVNNLSFLLFFLGCVFLVVGVVTEEGVGAGWTLYPPLVCFEFHATLACDFLIFSVHILGISSIINSLNVVCTIFASKNKNLGFLKLSLFLWMTFLTSVLLILAVPALAVGVTLVLLDRNLNSGFLDVISGGSADIFIHCFWIFGHPEVYIILLPVFAIISLLLEIGGRKLCGHLGMIYSASGIANIGTLVWAHHMFSVALDSSTKLLYSSATVAISLPTAAKINNYCLSLLGSGQKGFFEFFFFFFFIFYFTNGGLSGLILSNFWLDAALHDTYFIVGHFHFVLSIGALIGVIFGAIFLVIPATLARESTFLISIFFFVFAFAVFCIFMPMHSSGILGLPRRTFDFGAGFLGTNFFVFQKVALI